MTARTLGEASGVTMVGRDWCLGARHLFGVEHGDKMLGLMFRLTGRPCPCLEGEPCPLLPPPGPPDSHHVAVTGVDSTPVRDF